MKFLAPAIMLEFAIVILFTGNGSFLARIAANWHKSLILLIIYPFVRIPMQRLQPIIIKRLKENNEPHKQSHAVRVIFALTASILLIFGITELTLNMIPPKTFLYSTIIIISFPVATSLWFLAVYDPVNEKMSWEKLKK